MFEVNYRSLLGKEGLTYNIVYRLSNMRDDESVYSVIESILTAFEYFPVENS